MKTKNIATEFQRIGSNFDLIIFFSLVVTVIQQALWIARALSSRQATALPLILQTVLLLLMIVQIQGLAAQRRYTWILSAIQVISIFFLSVGTFGYLVSAILRPLGMGPQTYAYVAVSIAALLEITKTIYLYRYCGRTRAAHSPAFA